MPELQPLSPDLLIHMGRTLQVPIKGLLATVELLDEGANVPFIARYRKEATGNLDEVQIRAIEEKLLYFRELVSRKETILASIRDQGKLTDELKARIDQTLDKAELEDLYLPYKPKRRTKAMIAREKGLEPLAERIWAQREPPEAMTRAAGAFVDAARGVGSVEEALAGAQDILAERVADDADIRALVRDTLRRAGKIAARRRPAGEAGDGRPAHSAAADPEGKFALYYDYAEPLDRIPHHRVLA